jgi:hypothetical protein
MARPPLPMGTYGNIKVTQNKAGSVTSTASPGI